MSKQRRNDLLLKMVGEELRRLRCERGLSQEIVYIDTEIHIPRVEKGVYNLTISTLSTLCQYYQVSLRDFFRKIENP